MHFVLLVGLALLVALIVAMDWWDARCIEQCRQERQRMIEKIRELKRSGAIDDITMIKLVRDVHDVPFDEHVRYCRSRRDPAVLYPSELDSGR
jgi:hypothetical protein